LTSFTSTVIVVSGSSALNPMVAHKAKAQTIRQATNFELRASSREQALTRFARSSQLEARSTLGIRFM
jgi:hypothetical protein